MKRTLLFVLLTVVLGLFGCAHTMGRVEQRWGPPAKVEQQGDYTIYYYSFNKVGRRGSGVLNVILTCDNAGNILSKGQTWEPSEPVAPLPSPYMKKRAGTVQPVREEAEVSADPPDMKNEVGMVQPLHEEAKMAADPPDTKKEVRMAQSLHAEAEVSANPPDMKKDVGMVQSLHAEVEISADPPEIKKEVGTVLSLHTEAEVSADPPVTDPDVTLNVGVEGPPEGRGVYYDGPFDIDGISLYFYGGGFYYVAPGYPHRLLFHHRCPPGRLDYYRNHWRNGWRGFHNRWVESHKQSSRNDPKHEIHHHAPVHKANTPPPKTYTSSKANTPPPKTHTPLKANTPPPKTYTPSKANTPPPKTHTPSKANTPPVKTYTPPQKAYTPPPKQASVPIKYTPPPKHYNANH